LVSASLPFFIYPINCIGAFFLHTNLSLYDDYGLPPFCNGKVNCIGAIFIRPLRYSLHRCHFLCTKDCTTDCTAHYSGAKFCAIAANRLASLPFFL